MGTLGKGKGKPALLVYTCLCCVVADAMRVFRTPFSMPHGIWMVYEHRMKFCLLVFTYKQVQQQQRIFQPTSPLLADFPMKNKQAFGSDSRQDVCDGPWVLLLLRPNLTPSPTWLPQKVRWQEYVARCTQRNGLLFVEELFMAHSS